MIRNSRGKRPTFYETPGMDQVMSMLTVLASEVSVLADHIDGIERVAEKNGLDLKGGLASLELGEDALREREERRQALLGKLFYLLRKEAAEAEQGDNQARYEKTLRDIADSTTCAS